MGEYRGYIGVYTGVYIGVTWGLFWIMVKGRISEVQGVWFRVEFQTFRASGLG